MVSIWDRSYMVLQYRQERCRLSTYWLFGFRFNLWQDDWSSITPVKGRLSHCTQVLKVSVFETGCTRYCSIGLNVGPNMMSLHIFLNTAHLVCKLPKQFHVIIYIILPSNSSCLCPYTSPLQPPHFYKPTPNHSHSYIPDAQTILICHASPSHPQSEYGTQKPVKNLTSLSILQCHSTYPLHHQMLQIAWWWLNGIFSKMTNMTNREIPK